MTTDLLIHGTSIQTRATTDARERLPCDRMGQHARSAVVENYDVQLFRSFILRVALRAGDERLIRRQSLSRAGPGQKFQKQIEIRKTRNYSIPITAMCTRGRLVVKRMLPSFSTMTIVPVSEMPKLTPLIPTSAAAKRSRKAARAVAVNCATSSVGGVPNVDVNSSATCFFDL